MIEAINRGTTFSGYLVGIGKVRKDGSMEHKWLDKPIKNMIVKQGLNNWLRYNGSDTALGPTSNSADRATTFAYPMYNIQWCAYGTSGVASNFATTTDLVAASVVPYTTKVTGWPYCGTTRYDNVKIRNRISHQSDAALSDTSIREIGYYLKLNDNSYQLFSRIVLPASYELDVGEKLITTYDLIMEYSNVSEPTAPFMTGLLDANGQPLEAKSVVKFNATSSDSIPSTVDAPYINVSGEATNYTNNGLSFYPPIFNSSSSERSITYSKQPTAIITTPYTDSILAYRQNTPATTVIQPYVYDSFQRDKILTLKQFWPNLINPDDSVDVYDLKLDGVRLQFGHTVDGAWVLTPWHKTGRIEASITFRHTVATAESIAWQQAQQGNP